MDYQPQYIKNTCNQTPEKDIRDPVQFVESVLDSFRVTETGKRNMYQFLYIYC